MLFEPEIGEIRNVNGIDLEWRGKCLGWVKTREQTLDWVKNRDSAPLGRFLQIVITKNTDPELPPFHVTWQDETSVVKSGDFWGLGGYVLESAVRMEPPSPERVG